MREQADLSGAATLAIPAERRRFVFEALRAVADRAQRPLIEHLRARGVTFRPHYLLNTIEVEAEEGLLQELALRPDVASVAANRSARLQRLPAMEGAGGSVPLSRRSAEATVVVEPGIVRIRAPEVWAAGYLGQGIVVGIADTGVLWNQPALLESYRGSRSAPVAHAYNWHDAIHTTVGDPAWLFCGTDGANSPEPCDENGHGTSVAGIAVGGIATDFDGSRHQVGVAPGAEWIGCRNMDGAGSGTPASYLECFEFFLAPTDAAGENPRPDLGADIINNSWTCPASEGCTDPDILRAVAETVRAAGILSVAGAGNDGDACGTISAPPAIYAASFSVGATDNDDAIAPFSSRGPVRVEGSNRLKPDICAPGVSVGSTWYYGGYVGPISGTSVAAPHAAGAAALLWSARPELRGDVTATENLLRASAVALTSLQDCDPLPGTAVPNATYGYGRLDVAAALEDVLPSAARGLTRGPERETEPRQVPPRTPPD
jgi:subtilisin family serine protease